MRNYKRLNKAFAQILRGARSNDSKTIKYSVDFFKEMMNLGLPRKSNLSKTTPRLVTLSVNETQSPFELMVILEMSRSVNSFIVCEEPNHISYNISSVSLIRADCVLRCLRKPV